MFNMELTIFELTRITNSTQICSDHVVISNDMQINSTSEVIQTAISAPVITVLMPICIQIKKVTGIVGKLTTKIIFSLKTTSKLRTGMYGKNAMSITNMQLS